MSRNNPRSVTGRRKPGTDGDLNPLLLNEADTQRASSKNTRHMRKSPAGEPKVVQDVMQEVMVDIETMLDKQAAHAMPDNGVARRRIEMFREAQFLQRQLAESYDP